MGVQGREANNSQPRRTNAILLVAPPVPAVYDFKNTILVGQDAVQWLILSFYGDDVDSADQIYLYNTDKVGFNAAGYEGDSFECFMEEAYAEVIDNAIKSWTLSKLSLEDFSEAMRQAAIREPISPLEEQAYLLLTKMLGGTRTGDPFFDEFTPYRAIGIGRAQTGGDLGIIFMPQDITDQEKRHTSAIIEDILREQPTERMKRLVDLSATGAIGILREEIKAVSLGSDTFLNQGAPVRHSIDNTISQMVSDAGGQVEPVDFRKMREEELKALVADKQNTLRVSLLNIYGAIDRLSYDGVPLATGYKEPNFRPHTSTEIAGMSDAEIINLFNGHTFRKAFTLARKDPALKSDAANINNWTKELKKQYVSSRMNNFSQLPASQQQDFLILEAAMTFTGLRDEKIINGLVDKIKTGDRSWRDDLYLSSVQAYIDITRSGWDAQGSFIEYHKGFRSFLENIIGFDVKKNQFEMTIQPSNRGTLQYGVKDKAGKTTKLYGQANNTTVDENHLFGKLTLNHKPTKGFSHLFPTETLRLI